MESLAERLASLKTKHPWQLRKRDQIVRLEDATELQQRWEAMQLREKGLSYVAIGEALGVGETTARRWIHWAFDQIIEEPARDLRNLELRRLDALQAAHWAKATGENPDPKATEIVLKIMQYRGKILGIDQPATADPNWLLEQAEEIAAQLDLPVEEILNMADWFAQRKFLGEAHATIEADTDGWHFEETSEPD